MVKPLLVAMVGLPRSGKSTIAKQLAGKLGAPIVSRDSLRLVLTGRRYVAEVEPLVKLVSAAMLASLFHSGSEIIIYDETNFSRAARDSIRDPQRWDVRFLHVSTSKEECQRRAVEAGQADLVAVIEEMAARWEPLAEDEPFYAL